MAHLSHEFLTQKQRVLCLRFWRLSMSVDAVWPDTPIAPAFGEEWQPQARQQCLLRQL